MENTSQHTQGAKTFLTIVLIVLFAVASFLTAYMWQHRQVQDLHNTVDNLNTQITNQNSQLATLKSKAAQTCPPTSEQATSGTTCSATTYTSPRGTSMVIYSPLKNTAVSSPIAIIGEIPGNWSFEAQFPISLKDASGTIIARGTGRVLGSWQTTELVPFSAQLIYSGNHSGSGSIVIDKDNPSGLSTNSDSLEIPVTFAQ